MAGNIRSSAADHIATDFRKHKNSHCRGCRHAVREVGCNNRQAYNSVNSLRGSKVRVCRQRSRVTHLSFSCRRVWSNGSSSCGPSLQVAVPFKVCGFCAAMKDYSCRAILLERSVADVDAACVSNPGRGASRLPLTQHLGDSLTFNLIFLASKVLQSLQIELTGLLQSRTSGQRCEGNFCLDPLLASG